MRSLGCVKKLWHIFSSIYCGHALLKAETIFCLKTKLRRISAGHDPKLHPPINYLYSLYSSPLRLHQTARNTALGALVYFHFWAIRGFLIPLEVVPHFNKNGELWFWKAVWLSSTQFCTILQFFSHFRRNFESWSKEIQVLDQRSFFAYATTTVSRFIIITTYSD